MGELRFEHVEAELICLGRVALGRNELEAGVGIDKAANQPRARDAVDVDALPCHPDTATEVIDTGGASFRPVACARRPKPRLQAAHSAFRRFTARSAEE